MKLSQYRAAAGASGDSGGEQEQDKIARALLSNTDKEIIFDGLKKLYRKKVRTDFEFVGMFLLYSSTYEVSRVGRTHLFHPEDGETQSVSCPIPAPQPPKQNNACTRFVLRSSNHSNVEAALHSPS